MGNGRLYSTPRFLLGSYSIPFLMAVCTCPESGSWVAGPSMVNGREYFNLNTVGDYMGKHYFVLNEQSCYKTVSALNSAFKYECTVLRKHFLSEILLVITVGIADRKVGDLSRKLMSRYGGEGLIPGMESGIE